MCGSRERECGVRNSPLKISYPNQHSVFGHHRPASETPMMVLFGFLVYVFLGTLVCTPFPFVKKKLKENSPGPFPPYETFSIRTCSVIADYVSGFQTIIIYLIS